MRTSIARHFPALIIGISVLSLCSILLLTTTTTQTENVNAASSNATLSIALTAPSSTASHSPVAYQIQIDNAGPDAALNLKFGDRLPSGTTFASITSTLGTCTTPGVAASGIVNCSAPRLDPTTGTGNPPWQISIVVNVPAPGGTSLSNTATITSANDTHKGHDSSTVNTTVLGSTPTPTGSATETPPVTLTPSATGVSATGTTTGTATATKHATKTPTRTPSPATGVQLRGQLNCRRSRRQSG
jgi:uncharacterized repeat protein (TIGR01451 family)